MMHLIKGVLFDLDGTLLDRSESLKRFVTAQYDRLIKDLGNVTVHTYVDDFLNLDDNGYNSKNNVYQDLIDKYEWDPEMHGLLLEDYKSGFHDHCLPLNGFDVLNQFLGKSKLKVGLITNGESFFQNRTIEALSLQNVFHCTLISEEEGVKKPSPEIFERGLNQLNLRAEEVVFVGDHPLNDIKAAKDLGMKTIWIECSFYDQPIYADYTVSSLSLIPSIIQSMDREEI